MNLGWLRTYTGRKFHLLEPTPDMVCIEDIAHHLSMLCRYTGAVQRFYSVAEHSVLLTSAVMQRTRVPAELVRLGRWALLHDASEAYLGDISRPLKYTFAMEPYRAAEARVMRAIALRFGLEGPEPELIRAMDKEIIGTEARVLKFGEGLATVDPLPDVMPELREGAMKMGCAPEFAKASFLRTFEILWSGRDEYVATTGASA